MCHRERGCDSPRMRILTVNLHRLYRCAISIIAIVNEVCTGSFQLIFGALEHVNDQSVSLNA